MGLTTDKTRILKLLAEWNQLTPLSTHFPVTLPGGGEVNEFSGYCAKCDGEIPSADLHGSVTMAIPTVATISAVGLCRKCSCLTPFHHRVRSVNGNLQSEWIDDGGQWVKRLWNRTPTPGMLAVWVSQVYGWLKRRLHGSQRKEKQ